VREGRIQRAAGAAATPAAPEPTLPAKKKRKTSHQAAPPEPPRALAPPAPALPAPLAAEPPADEEGGPGWRDSLKRADVKSGPYSSAETAALRAAVDAFAAAKGLSTDDFSWLVVSGRGSRNAERAGVWKAAAAALPHRTIKSVAAAGLRLLHPHARQGKWTPEADAQLLALVEARGHDWAAVGAAMGRTRASCRDRWKEARLGSARARGPWEQGEVDKLKEAVQEYLSSRRGEGGEGGGGEGGEAQGPGRRLVLDDIDWGAVSSRVGTRSNLQCLEKWYNQLSPSMVERGDWGAGDDRRMLRALWTAAPGAEFEVQWGALVGGRTEAQARRRWRLMAKTVGDHREKEFPELLDALVSTHMPHWKAAAADAAQERAGEVAARDGRGAQA
jgi:hypothetical protein